MLSDSLRCINLMALLVTTETVSDIDSELQRAPLVAVHFRSFSLGPFCTICQDRSLTSLHPFRSFDTYHNFWVSLSALFQLSAFIDFSQQRNLPDLQSCSQSRVELPVCSSVVEATHQYHPEEGQDARDPRTERETQN